MTYEIGRRGGYTVEMLKYSAKHKQPVLVRDETHRDKLKDLAAKLDLDIPEPIIIDIPCIEPMTLDLARNAYGIRVLPENYFVSLYKTEEEDDET